MPELEVDDLGDFAVLLAAGGYNRYGRIGVTDVPVEIPCRWVENVQSAGGSAVDTAAVIAQVYVDRAIDLSSILWHGRLADFPQDWEDSANGLVEVSNFHDAPDVELRSPRRWVDVTRFRDELPHTG